MSDNINNTAANIQSGCIIKDMQFFAKESFLRHPASVNKYRTRFEEAEINFLYWDIELVNLLYKKESSSVVLKVRCTALTTQKKLYEGEQTICFQASDISIVAANSWGVSTGSYWTADQYLWEILINDTVQFSKTIIVDKLGMVSKDNNPYFDVKETKLFPAFTDSREVREGYRYLKQFNCDTIEYVGLELVLNRKFADSKNLEFAVTIINADSGLVYLCSMLEILYPACNLPATEYTRFTHGTGKNNFWVAGTYLFYVNFMDTTIAAGRFTVGDEEIPGTVDLPGIVAVDKPIKLTAEIQEAAVESALAQLDELTGMAGVKKAIHENIEYLRFNKLRMEKGFADDSQSNLHSIFTGNPGTGKTTVVRLLGKIYNAMGMLSKGHVTEATRADLIGEFVGQTAPKTKAMIEKARGGILFIDEIYSLVREGSTNDFGAEAIEILLVEMSDGKGDIAIIGAGYPAEVENFLHSNPGLQSRFGRYFNFEDYMPDELMQIAGRALKIEQATLSAEAAAGLEKKFTELYRSRDKYFGNGRLAFSIIDEAKKQMGIRLMAQGDLKTLSPEALSKIEIQDLQKVFEQDEKRPLRLAVNTAELNEALKELESLTGLLQIKQEIKDRINLVQFYAETGKDVLNKFSLHAILTGNPGTGKTTLARLLGKLYKALGLLERGHVVEVDRQSLVAGYVGQTALKTTAAINNAMGGVLFIDEAYALTGGTGNDFGSEAIETLLKRMEDDRGKFAVIAAGYTDNMNAFVHSNPGLQSRFDSTYNLPDYSAEELLQIAEKQLMQQELVMQPDATQYVAQYLNAAYENRDKYFGNARFVRQTVEAIITKQNLRLAAMPHELRTPEMLQQVLQADVEQLPIKENGKRQSIGFKTYN